MTRYILSEISHGIVMTKTYHLAHVISFNFLWFPGFEKQRFPIDKDD